MDVVFDCIYFAHRIHSHTNSLALMIRPCPFDVEVVRKLLDVRAGFPRPGNVLGSFPPQLFVVASQCLGLPTQPISPNQRKQHQQHQPPALVTNKQANNVPPTAL